MRLSVLCKYGGEEGIRTLVSLRSNGFQDRPVMTTSVPLQETFNLLTRHIVSQVVRGLQPPF